MLWRCYNSLMSKPGRISAKPLSILLSDVFSDAYAKQGFAARELVTRWGEIAGPEIAAHCEPLKMQWPRPVEGQPQEPATLVLRVEGPMALEISINRDTCMGSGNCSFWAPGVFDLDDDGIAIVLDPNAQPEDKVVLAAQGCPTQAITVMKDGEKLV